MTKGKKAKPKWVGPEKLPPHLSRVTNIHGLKAIISDLPDDLAVECGGETMLLIGIYQRQVWPYDRYLQIDPVFDDRIDEREPEHHV
jgi:hypothetical protein